MNRDFRTITLLKVFIFLFFVSGTASGQFKYTEKLEQVWTGYFNQTRISRHWGFWFDAQLRTKDDFFKDFSVLILRPGIMFYLNDNTKLAAGYGFIRHYPAGAHSKIARPEHRPWQQIQWHTKYARVRTVQYLRLEERYLKKILNDSTLSNAYNFNFRLRYNFLLQVPLSKNPIKKGAVSFIVNDEVHVNFGKQVVLNYFDQNRFFLGLAYQVNDHDNIQLGYLNVFQQLPAGNQYRSTHAARVFYFHNLDLRAK